MTSTAEIVKQCKVKTSSVKRLHKELGYYEKERDKEQARVDKMKSEGADASDVKQAVSCRTEKAHVGELSGSDTGYTLLTPPTIAGERPPRVSHDDSSDAPAARGSSVRAAELRGGWCRQALWAPLEHKLAIPHFLVPIAHTQCTKSAHLSGLGQGSVMAYYGVQPNTVHGRILQHTKHTLVRRRMGCVRGARRHA